MSLNYFHYDNKEHTTIIQIFLTDLFDPSIYKPSLTVFSTFFCVIVFKMSVYTYDKSFLLRLEEFELVLGKY